ncbi:hypothetical protein Pcar_3368 [Syntrophotalea carbinolica DSM 2380]|uniref:Uncharacterized protein n=1 Tax=Syntrophotalea carbinolica (strain DSM 2380 / NBRC 103641 / GraBd1) TaxID=338963 RepID=Q0C6F5_SYNC1|nr:hypothetical protein Pcar_3368 [Syntrophotalea carbinolica DSM 2380]
MARKKLTTDRDIPVPMHGLRARGWTLRDFMFPCLLGEGTTQCVPSLFL